MYIKGGMNKLSKAIAKSAREGFDKEIAQAQEEENQIQAMERQAAGLPPIDEPETMKFPTPEPSKEQPTEEVPYVEPEIIRVNENYDPLKGNLTMTEKCEAWKHNFAQLEPKEKFMYLIQQSKGVVKLDEKTQRIQGYRVYGCVSQVWVLPSLKGDNMILEMDADSHEARGVVYILKNIFSGHTPKEIIEFNTHDIMDIGFLDVLSMGRVDGTYAIIQAIKAYATDTQQIIDEQSGIVNTESVYKPGNATNKDYFKDFKDE